MLSRTTRFRKAWVLVAVVSLAMALLAPTAAADPDPDPDDGGSADGSHDTLERPDRGDSLAAHDALLANVVSEGSSVNENGPLSPAGRIGARTAETSTISGRTSFGEGQGPIPDIPVVAARDHPPARRIWSSYQYSTGRPPPASAWL